MRVTDDPQKERIARLVAELEEELPFEAREAFLSTLSDEDRASVWEAQLEEVEEVGAGGRRGVGRRRLIGRIDGSGWRPQPPVGVAGRGISR